MTMQHENQTMAWSEGYQAFGIGVQEDENPYHNSTQNYMDWDAGRFQASLDEDNGKHAFVVRGMKIVRVCKHGEL